MKIGVIGSGNIGGTLARKLVEAGHEVRIANSRGIEGVRSIAAEVGARPVDVHGAVEGVDAIIISVPFPAVSALPDGLFQDVPWDVPIIDTGNYYPELRDPRIPEIDAGQVESGWVSEQIGRPVVKAFNNIPVYSLAELGRPKGEEGRIAIAVAGDNAQQKRIVMNLIDEDLGFDPVDGGSIEESWRQQPATPSYCCDWDAKTMRETLAAAVPGEAARKLEKFPEQLAALGSSPSHADVIALNRSLY